jgi:tRNA threonylcarbamoyladenosine biosynthesis protein TsaB
MSSAVLVIDTASPELGVAVLSSEGCRFFESIRLVQGADGWLGEVLQRALQLPVELTGIAVVVGPGSFTGLRVGVSTALGLAVARCLPLFPLSALQLRASLAQGQALALVVLEARRGYCYAGLFDSSCLPPVPKKNEVEIALSELEAWAGTEPFVQLGETDPKIGQRLENAASSAVTLAWPLLLQAVAQAPEAIALRYLRDPEYQPAFKAEEQKATLLGSC